MASGFLSQNRRKFHHFVAMVFIMNSDRGIVHGVPFLLSSQVSVYCEVQSAASDHPFMAKPWYNLYRNTTLPGTVGGRGVGGACRSLVLVAQSNSGE